MEIALREVHDSDLPVFFRQLNDPEAALMAAEQYAGKLTAEQGELTRRNRSTTTRTGTPGHDHRAGTS